MPRLHPSAPIKQSITIRIDPDVLEWLKSAGPGYQTRINAILLREMLRCQQPAKPPAE